MRWADLEPVPEFVNVLDRVEEQAVQASSVSKRKWGKAFADQCAVMVANAVRQCPEFTKYEIRPKADGSGTEALTGVGGGEGKKVDVLVSSLASGLQVAASLKAENYPAEDGSFGKNLLNRSYEFSDEVRSIHSYQPRAVVVGMFFLPLAACSDRPRRSSFHRATEILRARTGRTDRSAAMELYKGDLGYVALYAAADIELPRGQIVRRGVLRFTSCMVGAPKVGRPKLAMTMDLSEVVSRIETYYLEGVEQSVPDAPPEDDGASV